jgi:hypothetical protein
MGWSGAIGILDKRDQIVVISMAASGTDVYRIERDGTSRDESLKRVSDSQNLLERLKRLKAESSMPAETTHHADGPR